VHARKYNTTLEPTSAILQQRRMFNYNPQYVPSSQVGPVHNSAHVQINPLPSLLKHVPPFWQGFPEQYSNSTKVIYFLRKCTKN